MTTTLDRPVIRQPRSAPGTPLITRLMARVDKNGPVPECAPHLGPCWLWTGAAAGRGYGVMNIAGRLNKTHRISYELYRRCKTNYSNGWYARRRRAARDAS